MATRVGVTLALRLFRDGHGNPGYALGDTLSGSAGVWNPKKHRRVRCLVLSMFGLQPFRLSGRRLVFRNLSLRQQIQALEDPDRADGLGI